MIRLNLFTKTLRDHRGALIGIGLANLAIAAVETAMFPSFKESFANFQMPEAFSGLLGEAGAGAYRTFDGFIAVEFFSWLPILLIVLAITGGTAALVGEEAAGTLDMLLAQPVRRIQLVLWKTAALVVALAIAALASLPGFLLALLFVDVDVNLGHLTLAVLNTVPLALLFLSLSLWGSAVLPTRGAAVLLAAGVAVVTYFFNLIGAAVSSVEFLQYLSPFYWADAAHVFYHGFDWQRTGGFLLLAGVLFALALVSFDRRDIAVSTREWHLRALRHGKNGRSTPTDAPRLRAEGPRELGTG